MVLRRQFNIISFFLTIKGLPFYSFQNILLNVCLFYFTIKLFTMRNMFVPISKKRDSKVFGIELLTENEMLKVRGGTEPEKPKSRPIDAYDLEDE